MDDILRPVKLDKIKDLLSKYNGLQNNLDLTLEEKSTAELPFLDTMEGMVHRSKPRNL